MTRAASTRGRAIPAAILSCLALVALARPSLAVDGREVFMEGATPTCAVCHVLQDAGATGEIGPSLDELKPDEQRVARAVKHGVGAMPAFDEALSEEQIAAVSRYVAEATGAAKQ